MIVAMRLPGEKVGSSEAFEHLVDAGAEILKYGVLRILATIIFIPTHRVDIVAGY
jgi:hypothetical protein